METIVVYWGHIGEWKENGNYCSILGLYRGNGKEDGNYCSILGLYRGMEKNMEASMLVCV